MRILITGASGFLGAALSRRLAAGGHLVVPLGRRAPPAGGPTWDPEAGRLDPATFAGVDAVVHLAGESIGGGLWTAARKRRIQDSRVRGTTLLARTIAGLERPPAVMVSTSAVGFYGNRGDDLLTEAEPSGAGFLAGVTAAWEAATRPASEAGIRVARPRLGVVLDPAGGMLRQLLPLFRLGLGGRLGGGRQWLSWVALEDVLAVLELAIHSASFAGPWNVTSPEPVTNREFTATLARTLRRPGFLTAPAPALRLVLGQLAEDLLLASQRCVPARLIEHGYRFAQPRLGAALAGMLGTEGRPAADPVSSA